jgi:hypothetical protein
MPARQLALRVRATGGAGRKSTHERGDGKTGHNDVAGGWSERSICPLLDRQSTAFQEAGLGTGTVFWKAAISLEQSV